MGVHQSNMVSEVVEALGVVLDKGFGCVSTEDLLARFDVYNRQVKEGTMDCETERVLIGADAVGLFPSLDPDKCAKLVGEEFVTSDMKVQDVDYEVLTKYIAMNMSPGEIRLKGLHKAVPTRRYKYGPRPGVKSKEAYEPEDRDEEHSSWSFKRTEFSEIEKRKIIGATLQIAIAASFHLHLYTFGGRVYLQMAGGPIGSRLTMAVSKIVMLVWRRKLQEHLAKAKVWDIV